MWLALCFIGPRGSRPFPSGLNSLPAFNHSHMTSFLIPSPEVLLEANFRASRSKQCPADCSSAICLFTSFSQFEFEWFYPFVPLRDLFVTRGHLLQMTYLLQGCKYFFLVIISLSTFSMVSLTKQILFLCSQSANFLQGFLGFVSHERGAHPLPSV